MVSDGYVWLISILATLHTHSSFRRPNQTIYRVIWRNDGWGRGALKKRDPQENLEERQVVTSTNSSLVWKVHKEEDIVQKRKRRKKFRARLSHDVIFTVHTCHGNARTDGARGAPAGGGNAALVGVNHKMQQRKKGWMVEVEGPGPDVCVRGGGSVCKPKNVYCLLAIKSPA